MDIVRNKASKIGSLLAGTALITALLVATASAGKLGCRGGRLVDDGRTSSRMVASDHAPQPPQNHRLQPLHRLHDWKGHFMSRRPESPTVDQPRLPRPRAKKQHPQLPLFKETAYNLQPELVPTPAPCTENCVIPPFPSPR